MDINDNNLPIGLLFIQKSHNTQYLDLLNLASVTYSLTNLTDIQRIVVTLGLGLGVDGVGVLPGLRKHSRQRPFPKHDTWASD